MYGSSGLAIGNTGNIGHFISTEPYGFTRMSYPRPEYKAPDDIQRILAARQSGISRRESFARQIADDLAAIGAERLGIEDATPKNTKPFIDIVNLSFRYPSGKRYLPWKAAKLSPYALENISVTLRGPGVVMLAGRSGCGKSTLLRLLGGNQPFHRSQIGGCISFPATNGEDNVLAMPRNVQYQMREAASLLVKGPDSWGDDEYTRMERLRDVLSSTFNKVMLLDEPMRLIQRSDAKQFEDRLRRLSHDDNRLIVVVTHDWRFIRVADHVVLMENSRIIIDDSARNVLSQGDLPNYVRRTLDDPSPR